MALFSGAWSLPKDAIEQVFKGMHGYVNVGMTSRSLWSPNMMDAKDIAVKGRRRIVSKELPFFFYGLD